MSGAFRVLAVANQKGGVGKTTTAVNLGTALVSMGQKLLVIDLDPQGNASTGLGIPSATRPITTYHVLSGTATLSQAAVPTAVPNLFIVTANSDLVGFESEHHDDRNRPYKLRDALAALHAQGRTSALADFNYVLIDCPPSLNLLTLNAMVAANAVLVPVQCEFFALEGISQLKDTIDQIKGSLNPGLDIQGVVLTMHDARLGLSKEVASEVRSFFGAKVYETIIPRNVRLAEAPSHGMPIILYDYDSPGSQAYINLSREILAREGLIKAA
jgi:chromosome partitioning protein